MNQLINVNIAITSKNGKFTIEKEKQSLCSKHVLNLPGERGMSKTKKLHQLFVMLALFNISSFG